MNSLLDILDDSLNYLDKGIFQKTLGLSMPHDIENPFLSSARDVEIKLDSRILYEEP